MTTTDERIYRMASLGSWTMSAETVVLVRSLQPGPDVDLAALVTDDGASARWRDEVAHRYADDLVCDFRFPAMAPVSYRGLDGFRAAWRDWLARWGSYYVEIEDVKDAGDSVVVVTRDRGRRLLGSTEEVYIRAAIWTVRDGRVVRMKFNLRRDEALSAVGLAG